MSFDVVVIGAGPAGLAAALHLARRDRQVAVVDPLGPGGQLINVELLDDLAGFAPVAGWDLAAALGEQVMAAGVELRFGSVVGLTAAPGGWEVRLDGDELMAARAVLLATGTRPAPLPGPDADRLTGRGVSYCAVCDGGLFAGRRVVVAGGGDRALAEVATLAELAAEVVLLCPDPAPTAARPRLDAVSARANVRLVCSATVVAVLGEDRVRAVRWLDGEGVAQETATDAVFGAVAELPNSDVVSALATLDGDRYVCTGEGRAVLGAPPGLFAAGDVRRGAPRYASVALGEGTAAAIAIDGHLG